MAQLDDNHQNTESHRPHREQEIASTSNYSPKDLLQSFISGNCFNHKLQEEADGDEDGGVELSLGLSLNGRFGVNKLTRSSSIPDFTNPTEGNRRSFMVPMVSSNLGRTCSLPTETEEEWQKRKEMQTLRRLEVKRKRLEKQKIVKALKDRTNSGLMEEISCEELKRLKGIDGSTDFSGAGVESLLAPAKVTLTPQLSQGSVGSQGSGSSGISEADGPPVHVQVNNKCADVRSPVSVQSLSECEQKLGGSTSTQKASSFVGENGCSTPAVAGDGAKETVRNVLEDMPCVSARGDGPNGRRIEGFLYRYRKGEEVRIVCVCHGKFLSPAEFVKHAGGGDVAHPLKHIVVNPSPLL